MKEGNINDIGYKANTLISVAAQDTLRTEEIGRQFIDITYLKFNNR
jgi:hypothetical protein